MKCRWLVIAAVCVLSLLGSRNADAAPILLGQMVNVSYRFPDINTVFNGNSVDVLVGPGTEISGFPVGDPRTNIDLSDTNIFVTYNSASTWTSTAFNGLRFFDVNGTIPALVSVTINAATNMVGLDASRITFDADHIWVNWQGLAFNQQTIVSLDVNASPAAVPEPATFVLLGAGLVSLGLRRKMRKA
jgi:PEP-CTERM motif